MIEIAMSSLRLLVLKSRVTKTQLTLLFLLLFLLPTTIFAYSVPHVHFVDKSSDNLNFLFRGGDPNVNQGQFGYEELKLAIRNAAKNANVNLPESYYLIDINLTNMDVAKGDGNRTISEFKWFEKNAEKGKFIFWETHGTSNNVSYPTIPSEFIPQLTKSLSVWLGDQLEDRIEYLWTLLSTKLNQAVVIYGHCDCGCDRTGELFGSYYMRWMNLTWEEANELNKVIAERPMECHAFLAMQWYCLWLNTNYGRNLNCLSHQPCTSFDVLNQFFTC